MIPKPFSVGRSLLRSRPRSGVRAVAGASLALIALLAMEACGGGDPETTGGGDGQGLDETDLGKYSDCTQVEVAAWTPDVDGADASNHDDAALEVTEVLGVRTVHPIPLNGSYSEAPEDDGTPSVATFSFDVDEDLGASGSVTLVATRGNLAQAVEADLAEGSVSVTPVLVSLVDPAGNEYVNLSGSCSSGGLYECGGVASCDYSSSCTVDEGGAFLGSDSYERRTQWEQHHDIASEADSSVVTFPTCLWTGGYGLQCPFDPASNGFLNGGRLREGRYTAKYVLLTTYIATSGGTPVPGGAPLEETGKIQLRTLLKKDADLGVAGRGALDLNVILAGSSNIQASQTSRGAMNLDLLFQLVAEIFEAENPSIRLGTIRAFEWDCSSEDLEEVDLSDTPELFRAGSVYVEEASESTDSALNVFFVSSIPASISGTILGRAGAIPGAMISGTRSSGVVFSSFDLIEEFNQNCDPGEACPKSMMDSSFIDMATTVAHEAGHFLGLNHPSESDGTVHDGIDDTPVCSATGASSVITIASCRIADSNTFPASGDRCSDACAGGALVGSCSGGYSASSCFCPAVEECQFNHVMWWSAKNIGSDGTGDGNLFSVQSSEILNLSPLVR